MKSNFTGYCKCGHSNLDHAEGHFSKSALGVIGSRESVKRNACFYRRKETGSLCTCFGFLPDNLLTVEQLAMERKLI